jgi:hypothetical protein
MISESAQPIYIYPDQLITETWPDWVETILSKSPPDANRNSRGFQELAGVDNSTVRTRAGEAYRMGLLLHRVIREREEGASTPKGWDYVCKDKTVLSRTGHLSYAIGKALSKHADDADIHSALNVLYLLFSMSIGTNTGGMSVSTTLVYRRVLQCFRVDVGAATFDAKYDDYSRLLAAAVFKTLDSPTARAKLLDEYINADHITALILEKQSDHSEHSITAATLSAKLSGASSTIPGINEIPRAKAALFWASPERGIYTRAAETGLNLLDALIPLDRAALKETGNSILDQALRVDGNQEHLLLENLNALLIRKQETSAIWGQLMEKLAQGVYAALAYLEDNVDSLPKPKQFHLHGVPEFPSGTTPLTVEIARSGIPIRPELGASVFIRKEEYRVKDMDEQPTGFKITLELTPSPAMAQP